MNKQIEWGPMKAFDRITFNPDILAGKACIRGMRIPVSLIVNLVAYYSSMISYKLGLDPDNITIPTITSLMDLMGTGILIVVLMVLGLV